MIETITPLLITFNEERNIVRTLAKLEWASQIVVIDSGSTDRTLEILADNPKVMVVHREFDSFAGQCNFGLTQVDTDWVLSLDADYVLTDELVEELIGLRDGDGVNGFEAAFTYCVYGRPLRGSLYPARTVLYRRTAARYEDEGHGHRVRIDGLVKKLGGEILHDDRKSLQRWFKSQLAYAIIEAHHIQGTDSAELPLQDRLRKYIWPSVPAVVFYTLVWKRCLLDGWRGWFYVLQRVYAEVLLALHLLEHKLSQR